MVDTLASPCRIILGKPAVRIFLCTANSQVKYFDARLLWVFPRRKKNNRIPKDMYWEIIVESAAPRMPRFKPHIRMASPAIFKIPPETSPTIARLA